MSEKDENRSVTKNSKRLQMNTSMFQVRDIGIKTDIYLLNGQIEAVRYESCVEVYIKGCCKMVTPNGVKERYQNIVTTIQLTDDQFESLKDQLSKL